MVSKKVVLILVLVALVLATLSIIYNMSVDSSDKKVLTVYSREVISANDLSSGQIGVKVSPPVIEDKT